MPKKTLYLIAGLGNPGTSYLFTRHNFGFIIIDNIADTYNINLRKSKFDADYGKGIINDINVILAKPMAYMNLSGQPIRRIADYFDIKSENIIIVHDDVDIEYGNLKIKEKGGHGGHKGIESIIDSLNKTEFIRIRMGISRPVTGISISDYVLSRFSSKEEDILDKTVQKAKESVITILYNGVKEGMNRFNRRTVINQH